MASSSNRDSSARAAAHILISGSHSGESSSYTASGRNQPESANEAEMRFSSVRRMFCLFVTFDLLFIGTIWILYVNTSGISGGLKEAFCCQVNDFSIHTSMFDIVLLAAGRVMLLLLAYALFQSKHWFTVAFTTSMSCIFLICKIVLFDFGDDKKECKTNSDAKIMEFFIFICCFVLTWIEVWILDLKVLPRERKREEAHNRSLSIATQNERTPLLNPAPQEDSSVPDQTFYSPIASTTGSDDECVEYSPASSYRSKVDEFQSLPNSQRGSSINLAASAEDQAYLEKAKEAQMQMQMIALETEGWKMERKRENIIVESRYFEGITGKVYKLEGIIEASVQEIFKVMWEGIDDTLKWNTTVIECRLLHSISSTADIVYSVAAEGAGGVVASRDFVSVRTYQIEGSVYRCASKSVEYPEMEPVKKYVRGENGPGGWIAEPLDGNPNISKFTWILNSDLKFMVWTPQTVLDTALSVVVMNIFFGLREHIKSLKQSSIPNGHANSNTSYDEEPISV
ncbi:stAR-related lipid transfer protein 3-like [Anneissia japonica]|uniref:stAR-related lipid transfer protein 3-like n=1 Tax=Anneissia japonica TaxID=1529436 RepID=UPI001425A49D|nr:stAR-related lipid transfer protein 3-like [Anneissia japonica]XP_033110702.1 stAR-related lipid transfer protein 3-like [Anneissia japonica]XP_033110703.1 stAR-related lipid transfer protein 3-like [Anneissia japonica]XP_033110704.1 stAR-related lipid transfer protein 3-like [Anneissia japonica]XP_033110707.1 stAR-related lipid transfer protein 3-like [Anneissia japonica]XP_033110708.1 stAR-related lipid transfer protein 3-like [Anneissia japonica]